MYLSISSPTLLVFRSCVLENYRVRKFNGQRSVVPPPTWHQYNVALANLLKSLSRCVGIVQAVENNDAEFKSGRESLGSLNALMYLMTHWPHRQIKIDPHCSKIFFFFLCFLFIWNRSNDEAYKKNDQAVFGFEISGMTGKSVYCTIVVKTTGVEWLSEPLCPEPDVRPPLFFHLTLRWPVSRLRRRMSCCDLYKKWWPSWIECNPCQISLLYVHLTTSICS